MSINPTVTTRTTCRACGSGPLEDLFSLGDQAVSGFPAQCRKCHGEYLRSAIEEVCDRCDDTGCDPPPLRCPIDLVRCPACTLVQQRYTVPSDLLYRRHYWYRSGTTDTMRRALKDVVQAATARVRLDPGDVVLDIGSNDGTLLRQYPDQLVRVGVEPAENFAGSYDGNQVYGINDFWSEESYCRGMMKYVASTGRRLGGSGKPKIITACGMLYDLEDPFSFIRDVARVLAPDGLFVAQLQCLAQTVRLRDVGNYCHEHLEFYTLRALGSLLIRAGLYVEDVEENAVNGGSYRLYCRKQGYGGGADVVGLQRVIDATCAEDDAGLTDVSRLQRHGADLKASMANLYQTVESIVSAGKTVWVYGASTKGNVVLQSAGIDHRLVKYAADRSAEKVGRYCAGSGILVRSEEDFRRERPDFAIMMPYGFRTEFIEREQEWRRQGGRFIVPIPSIEVV